ncbi:MAG TPA: ribonuclease HII [Candidatus Nanoarchaeia archaeon]|nr:ribonuclease HII [uncultured archaeon]
MRKVAATFDFENSLWRAGYDFIVGIDEVGRGAWAGPLVAAAVIFPKDYKTKVDFFDSKLLTDSKRKQLAKIIKKEAVCFGLGIAGVEEIVRLGLGKATQLAYRRALKGLNCQPDHYLIDAFYIKSLAKKNQTPIIHGDSLCASIAAASIVAKVYRDRLLGALGRLLPSYGLSKNKGYGTAFHKKAIRQFGLSGLHRTNYHLKFLYE